MSAAPSSLAMACGLAVAGCFPGYQAQPRVLPLPPASVQVSTGPLSYHAPTPARASRARREVTGRACQSGITLPLGWLADVDEGGNDQVRILALGAGWGDGGYAEAMADAQRQADGPLYDVRADLHLFSILGVWREQCVEVRAAVGESGPAPASDAIEARLSP